MPNYYYMVRERHVAPNGRIRQALRERLPDAAFSVLADVGHEPMLDDPELVARTILTVTGAAKK